MFSFKICLILLFISRNSCSTTSSPCHIVDGEITCKSGDFQHFESALMDKNIFLSATKLYLTNAYLSGLLANHIEMLTIDDYPYESFPSPFSSLSTLNSLLIQHTGLEIFPPWFCTFNSNLTSIEIDNSHIAIIITHDLNLCFNLRILRISNSYLRQFQGENFGVESSLSVLDLNNNYLTSLSQIDSINLTNFHHLHVLDVSYNRIDRIVSSTFIQTPCLTALDLSYNRIHSFELNQVTHLASLRILRLRGNDRLEISHNWQQFLPRLIVIDFPYAYFCCHHRHQERQRVKRDILIINSTNDPYEDSFLHHLAKIEEYPVEDLSLSISFDSPQRCYPLPDRMTPSNLTAFIIALCRLSCSYNYTWSISIVLSSNLALANLISSFYLIFVNFVDIHFQNNFYIKTHLWQNSRLCTLAGFIYILGKQASVYALTLLTFERFYTILFSFKRHIPWPPRLTFSLIFIGWLINFFLACLPLMNINNFHDNAFCVPFRTKIFHDRLYLYILILFDLSSIIIILICDGLICFNLSKSHVYTSNDARATLKILILVLMNCLSQIPLIIVFLLALVIQSSSYDKIRLDFNQIKFVILFFQPLAYCFNPFMYSSLCTFRWVATARFEQRPPHQFGFIINRSRPKSKILKHNYHALRMMSITSFDYRSPTSTSNS